MEHGEAINILRKYIDGKHNSPLTEAIEMSIDALSPKGSFQCFHCLHRTVVWQSDFSFEDYCLEGEGIVHILHCANCGADIEYCIPIPGDSDEE